MAPNSTAKTNGFMPSASAGADIPGITLGNLPVGALPGKEILTQDLQQHHILPELSLALVNPIKILSGTHILGTEQITYVAENSIAQPAPTHKSDHGTLDVRKTYSKDRNTLVAEGLNALSRDIDAAKSRGEDPKRTSDKHFDRTDAILELEGIAETPNPVVGTPYSRPKKGTWLGRSSSWAKEAIAAIVVPQTAGIAWAGPKVGVPDSPFMNPNYILGALLLALAIVVLYAYVQGWLLPIKRLLKHPWNNSLARTQKTPGIDPDRERVLRAFAFEADFATQTLGADAGPTILDKLSQLRLSRREAQWVYQNTVYARLQAALLDLYPDMEANLQAALRKIAQEEMSRILKKGKVLSPADVEELSFSLKLLQTVGSQGNMPLIEKAAQVEDVGVVHLAIQALRTISVRHHIQGNRQYTPRDSPLVTQFIALITRNYDWNWQGFPTEANDFLKRYGRYLSPWDITDLIDESMREGMPYIALFLMQHWLPKINVAYGTSIEPSIPAKDVMGKLAT